MRILIDTKAANHDDPVTELLKLADRIRKREVQVRKTWLDGQWELAETTHDDKINAVMTRKEDR